jgi:cellulase/cellobiase CelA1
VNSQWQNGFTAAIRIKNTGARAINRWSINWQYTDGSKVTNLWNAQLWDSGIPGSYAAGNLDWNAIIQPGQTVEFGFQGTKPASAAQVPVVRGSPCL